MKRTATTVRCVPRYGYDFAEVRTIDLDLPEDCDEEQLERDLTRWFAIRGLVDAVYSVEYDENGMFAVVNDEAFEAAWGQPLL